jgi:uncharacterized protein YodC (DUF2158 family)
MTPIKPGDQVSLKSGGPKMTVSLVEDDEAVCIWFEGQLQHTHRFNLITLVVKPEFNGLDIGRIMNDLYR